MSSPRGSRRHEVGLSLVELMISLLLGSLVIIAATRLFLTNQQAFQMQQTQSEAQEIGRYALEYILADARRQGARLTSSGLIPDGPGATGPGTLVGEDDVTTSGRGGMGNIGSDRLVVRYYDSDAATPVDCEGTAVLTTGTTPRLIVNTYYLANYSDATGGALLCDGNGDTNATGAEIATNVDGFQVLYGVAGSSSDTIPTRYVPFSGLGGNRVLGIRIALLVRSSGQIEGVVRGLGYPLLDTAIPAASVLDDRRLRRLFIGTAYIRNLN